jgi:magnesium chelatase family protein
MAQHFGRVMSAQPALLDAHIVSVEADYSQGIHSFSIVGLPDKAVEEAKDRVGSALRNSGFSSPKHSNKKVVVSLAPARVKKEGAYFDTPIALAYLLAAGEIACDTQSCLFIGELGLDGSARSVPGVLPIAKTAEEQGYQTIYVPKANADEAAHIRGIDVFGFETLKELIDHINKKPREDGELRHGKVLQKTQEPHTETAQKDTTDDPFGDIRGQSHAKRGIMIAAAGGHNIALFGPPGTGKTLLARALASVLPDLTDTEALEVHSIHSVAGMKRLTHDTRPPVRSPHHTSSYVALVGGGTIPKPGEVTLAHHGLLFLDEFPEFDKKVINALRQPLEDGEVSISRARTSVRFPSRFILVAALNPCPCGFGGGDRCTCPPLAVTKYQQKISGPVADRIDMWIEVSPIGTTELLNKHSVANNETAVARQAVQRARARQETRYAGKSFSKNASVTSKHIQDYIPLTDSQKHILAKAATTLQLSPRAIHRIIRLARTIADLEDTDQVSDKHLLESLQYRARLQ